MLSIYTMSSDSRAADLCVLLESLRRFPCSVHVIPFADDTHIVKQVCDIYGATLVDTDPYWDMLGRSLFCDSTFYRPNVPAWRLFRKFNAISDSCGQDFIFLHANVAVFDNLQLLLNTERGFDICFGHRAKTERNFKPWFKRWAFLANPYLNDGFGADFWFVKNGCLTKKLFKDLCRHKEFASCLGEAPEQSCLNLLCAWAGLNVTIVPDAVKTHCFYVVTKKKRRIDFCNGQLYLDDKKVLCVKWTGKYHDLSRPFLKKRLQRPFVEQVLKRCGKENGLFRHLHCIYSSIYGHNVDC